MARNKSLLINALMAFSLFSSYVFADEGKFTNKDFLALSKEQQKFWLLGSAEALFHIAVSKNKGIGQCVHDWYFRNEAETNGLIFGYAEKYPDKTVAAVMIALSEGECGEYRK